MITMTQIAKLTHVSQPTVSRVLSGSASVAPEIRERVLSCAREHNYQPNALAKGLQGGRTRLLGLMVPDVSDRFFAALARSVEEEARRQGCSVILLGTGRRGENAAACVETARRYRVDGALAAPARDPGASWHPQELDAPVVAVAWRAKGLDSVYVDQRQAGAQVARHLVERCYGRFLFIGAETDEKYAGFRQALAEHALDTRTECVPYEDGDQLRAALDARFRRPSARIGVFAGDDELALQTLSILRELGVPTPRRAGVVGFGDDCMGRYLSPQLSSVSQPVDLLARRAVERLLYRVEHPEGESALDLALPAELEARESA